MASLPIIFARTNSPAAWAIRAQAWGGPWSHCGVVDGDRVIEALFLERGVVSTPLRLVQERSSRYEIVHVWCPNPEQGLIWARSRLALPGQRPIVKYDHRGVLGIALRERRLQDPMRAYCSEECAETVKRSGLTLIDDRTKHGISPCDLYYAALAVNNAVRAAGKQW